MQTSETEGKTDEIREVMHERGIKKKEQRKHRG